MWRHTTCIQVCFNTIMRQVLHDHLLDSVSCNLERQHPAASVGRSAMAYDQHRLPVYMHVLSLQQLQLFCQRVVHVNFIAKSTSRPQQKTVARSGELHHMQMSDVTSLTIALVTCRSRRDVCTHVQVNTAVDRMFILCNLVLTAWAPAIRLGTFVHSVND